MKMSIRTRLFITVSSLIVFFVAFSWLLNTGYLEKYYIEQNKSQLLIATNNIDAMYTGSVEDVSLELERLERLSGLNILILDQNLVLKYSSAGGGSNAPMGPDRRRNRQTELLIPLVSTYQSALHAGDKVIAVSHDPNLQSDLLNVVARLNNGDYLLMSKSLVAFQDSAAVANRFFLFTGLLTILLGCLAVYIFARRFTRPILKLNAIAQKMSGLDFSEKYVADYHDELGELGASINSLSDQLDKSISELQSANQKLMLEIEHERRIDEMRKQFISNVSHELKTPIALIQGYAEGLKVNVIDDEDSKNYYCDVITDEAAKMNKMVLELLDLSQIEAGYFQLDKAVFDISGLVRQVLDKYELILKDSQISLVQNIPKSLLVHADRTRIEQVLVNYLNNAINHVDERREIGVKVEEQGNKVHISVFNTGRPIPEEAQDKLFTSFYKVDQARTRAYGGTGLGLSIVRAIMEQHKSKYGTQNLAEGVAFWIELDKVGLA